MPCSLYHEYQYKGQRDNVMRIMTIAMCLAGTSPSIDAGRIMSDVNEKGSDIRFSGRAPDLDAYEVSAGDWSAGSTILSPAFPPVAAGT